MTFFKKLLITLLIHGITAALFVTAFTVPTLFSFLQHTEHNDTPLGTSLIFLSSTLILQVWYSPPGAEGRYVIIDSFLKKISCVLCFIFNAALTFAYLSMINYFF
jgi:uncharacterized membrane protein required for colicin V production